MLYLIAVSAAIAAGLVVLALAQLVPSRSGAVTQRVREVATMSHTDVTLERRRRHEQRERLEELLAVVGRQLKGYTADSDAIREQLVHAGYRSPRAPAVYWGIRMMGALVMALIGLVTMPILGGTGLVALMVAVYLGLIGYLAPMLVLRSKVRQRQKEIVRTLPDTLDLLVVCVEAGLGLNQAFLRVAEEMQPLSELVSEELHLLNLEIRAGRARDEALRNLYERTGVDDVRTLALMLIQADRFGTSIANALRVHADTLRDKRRQRAEEAAAKTAIKLVFPLVLCIFPAMFVVLVAPGFIQITEALRGIG